MEIREDDLTGQEIRGFLSDHLEHLKRVTPPGSVYAHDIERLREPDVTFWSAWEEGQLVGCGALKAIGAYAGEIKSMRTHASHLKRGVGSLMLEHLLAEARSRSYRKLSLETGKGGPFEAALSLYAKYGFKAGPAFADYEASDFSQYLHLDL